MKAIIEKIKNIHSNDKEQLEVIFSPKKRIIVEAPAGFGKTQTMISKIAYLIASNQVPYPKRILALTFSVNTAYKIRREVAENLPIILEGGSISPTTIKNKVFATNYHGFCRRVLNLYGYLLHPNLKQIEFLHAIDDSKIEDLIKLNIGLNYDNAKEISDYNDAVKQIKIGYLQKNVNSYLNYVKKFFLPNNYISFNSILVLALELFKKYPKVLEFYKAYFPVIIVDEFQDTNILSWTILKTLVNEHTQIAFMGDPLQRIYGFIGAIPNLMSKAQKKYTMHKIELKTNYRFKDNPLLLLIDKNIRENAKNPRIPTINEPSRIKIFEAINQNEEAKWILSLIQKILKYNQECKIAILVKQRGKNIDKILEMLKDKIDYFYALYSDEDEEYIKFHQEILKIFFDVVSSAGGRINKAISDRFLRKCKEIYEKKHAEIYDSLLQLLETFLIKVSLDYSFLTLEEKIEFIRDTLENKSLKQYLMYVNSNIVVSTVHGAKGLEWDYVILPDLEQYSFPNWPGLCDICAFKNDCLINWNSVNPDDDFEKKFYEELSVFYVGATRAKKEIYFSYSKIGLKANGRERSNNMSCFLKLHGFKYILIKSRIEELSFA
ncbi:MAG: UvrD-helicase domain-containing protein [Desulfurella sp.]